MHDRTGAAFDRPANGATGYAALFLEFSVDQRLWRLTSKSLDPIGISTDDQGFHLLDQRNKSRDAEDCGEGG